MSVTHPIRRSLNTPFVDCNGKFFGVCYKQNTDSRTETFGLEDLMHILWWVIVGLIAGWATGKIMKGSGYGALMDIVIGIAGALIGGFIMRAMGFAGRGGMIYTIAIAILGAVILTAVLRLLKRT